MNNHVVNKTAISMTFSTDHCREYDLYSALTSSLSHPTFPVMSTEMFTESSTAMMLLRKNLRTIEVSFTDIAEAV